MAQCPMCGKSIDEAAARATTGQTAFGAAEVCRKKKVSSSVRMCDPSTSASVMMMILW